LFEVEHRFGTEVKNGILLGKTFKHSGEHAAFGLSEVEDPRI
jgi:hypothetical protein